MSEAAGAGQFGQNYLFSGRDDPVILVFAALIPTGGSPAAGVTEGSQVLEKTVRNWVIHTWLGGGD